MRTTLSLFGITLAWGVCAQAGIIISAEAPGVQATTRAGAIVETFDALATGPLGVYTSIIGDYTTGAQIVAPNAYGGSGQTNYISVGAQSKTTFYFLDFEKDLTYFGLYWGAGDAKNKIGFFSGETLLAVFTVADWAPALSAAYFGNPNTGQNKGEKYAFLNFDATNGTTFNRIKFFNDGTGTGFETDNHTILGAPVPEPATWTMIVGIAAMGLARKRRLI